MDLKYLLQFYIVEKMSIIFLLFLFLFWEFLFIYISISASLNRCPKVQVIERDRSADVHKFSFKIAKEKTFLIFQYVSYFIVGGKLGNSQIDCGNRWRETRTINQNSIEKLKHIWKITNAFISTLHHQPHSSST